MTQGVFIKRKGALYPADPVAGDLLAGIADEKLVLCDVTTPRNPKQNAFIHALLSEIVKHTDRFKDIDDLKRFLKLRSRMYHLIVIRHSDGSESTALELQSTAFGSMDQTQFARVWNRWKDIIRHEIIPDLDDQALRMQILEQIA